MTRPRTSPQREVIGVLGAHPDAPSILKQWNRFFVKAGVDAAIHRYPATTKNLPERLSEMFHFDRRAYIVAPSLAGAVLPLLDRIDADAKRTKTIDIIVNEGGILRGCLFPKNGHQEFLRGLFASATGNR